MNLTRAPDTDSKAHLDNPTFQDLIIRLSSLRHSYAMSLVGVSYLDNPPTEKDFVQIL